MEMLLQPLSANKPTETQHEMLHQSVEQAQELLKHAKMLTMTMMTLHIDMNL